MHCRGMQDEVSTGAVFDILLTSPTLVFLCSVFKLFSRGQCFRSASGSRFGPALPVWLMILMRQFVKIKTIIHSCCGALCVPITVSYL